MPYEILREMPEAIRATARVSVVRGHDGIKHPYSIPFSLAIEADGHPRWWAWLNFDLLYCENPYGAPNLLARHFSLLRRIAEHRNRVGSEAEIDPSIWRAIAAICYRPDDPYQIEGPADLKSRRDEFTRKQLAELTGADPREFYIYPMLTITGANSRQTADRIEFRIVSRPEAPHRWLFWTHAPRLTDDPVETAFWFKRHVAQLRGPRRPRWTAEQKERWLAAVHRELTGKTEAELALESLAAPAHEKPDVSLILGTENAAGGVKRWMVPRAAFADHPCVGTELRLAFVDSGDQRGKEVRLLFRTVEAVRSVLGEVLSGERRRLGIGPFLRGMIATSPGEEYVSLVGLSPDEEAPHLAAFRQRFGEHGMEYRSGLSLMLIEPYQPKTSAGP
ncbi:MAG TPA: hypothetical protein PKX00_03430 [Opitutaceae bacterium]|nr:hypothetical protein [Opitutaceae bacterium]